MCTLCHLKNLPLVSGIHSPFCPKVITFDNDYARAKKKNKNQSQKSKSLLIYWIPHNWSKPNLWFVAWISSQAYIYWYPHCFNIMRGRTITWPKILDETAAAKRFSPKPQLNSRWCFWMWCNGEGDKTPREKKEPGLQQVRDATLKSLHKALLGQQVFWRLNKKQLSQ